MAKINILLTKWKISKWQALLLLAGLLGLLLLSISSLPGRDASRRAAASQNPASEAVRVDLAVFEQQLEQRLTELISSIAGAGETIVMLTFESGSEPIFATQGTSDRRVIQDGERMEEHVNDRKEYVIIGSGPGQQGLILRMIEPQVRGVAVIAQGGGDVIVRQAIVEAVTAVLGVGANKVSGEQMGN